MTDLATTLAAQRLLPVLRTADAAAVRRATELLQAGLRVVELTTSTRDWPDAVAAVTAAAPGHDTMIGVGTVTTLDHARLAIAAGARFLVSPFPVPEVRGTAWDAGVPLVEGGFTPAEIADAARRGPAKVFPAHVGGPAFVRSLLAVLPDAQLIPTGGILPEQAGGYLKAGALAVGIGSGLPSDPAALASLLTAPTMKAHQ
jgi:2-dehydro-3-deoxyphosphogluconate aldolase/(4S)-4-hydroxy-2-oxoglutarate aldolase